MTKKKDELRAFVDKHDLLDDILLAYSELYAFFGDANVYINLSAERGSGSKYIVLSVDLLKLRVTKALHRILEFNMAWVWAKSNLNSRAYLVFDYKTR